MHIKARQKGGIIVLDLSGDIDVNAASFVEAVGQCLRDGFSEILCNFEDVEKIDYMGISVVVIAYKEVMNNRGRLKFCNVAIHIKNMLSVAGIDKVIEIYPTEDSAIDGFKEDKVIENIKNLQLRRRFKRLPIDIKVELKEKSPGGKAPVCFNVDIINLSALGAYIYGCNQFRLGDIVVLTFSLGQKKTEMKVDAKVVWLSDKQIQPHNHPGMGVVFQNIPMDVQEKLLVFIEKNMSFMLKDE